MLPLTLAEGVWKSFWPGPFGSCKNIEMFLEWLLLVHIGLYWKYWLRTASALLVPKVVHLLKATVMEGPNWASPQR